MTATPCVCLCVWVFGLLLSSLSSQQHWMGPGGFFWTQVMNTVEAVKSANSCMEMPPDSPNCQRVWEPPSVHATGLWRGRKQYLLHQLWQVVCCKWPINNCLTKQKWILLYIIEKMCLLDSCKTCIFSAYYSWGIRYIVVNKPLTAEKYQFSDAHISINKCIRKVIVKEYLCNLYRIYIKFLFAIYQHNLCMAFRKKKEVAHLLYRGQRERV